MKTVKTVIEQQLKRARIAFDFDKLDYHEYMAIFHFVEELKEELGIGDDDE